MGIIVNLLMIFIFNITTVLSQESDNMDVLLDDPMLSLKYQRGKYLVYDCSAKHWVCTSFIEHKVCKDEREIAKLDKNLLLPCGAFNVFVSEKECNLYQQKLTSRNSSTIFCVNKEMSK